MMAIAPSLSRSLLPRPEGRRLGQARRLGTTDFRAHLEVMALALDPAYTTLVYDASAA